MWGDRVRRKKQVGSQSSHRSSYTLNGVFFFYSKFRLKLDPVFLQLSKKYTSACIELSSKGGVSVSQWTSKKARFSVKG